MTQFCEGPTGLERSTPRAENAAVKVDELLAHLEPIAEAPLGLNQDDNGRDEFFDTDLERTAP